LAISSHQVLKEPPLRKRKSIRKKKGKMYRPIAFYIPIRCGSLPHREKKENRKRKGKGGERGGRKGTFAAGDLTA